MRWVVRRRISDTLKNWGLPSAMTQALESLSNGRVVSQVIDDGKRFDVLMKLSDADRSMEALAQLRMETPAGYVPLSSIAAVVNTDGPNQIMRENGHIL